MRSMRTNGMTLPPEYRALELGCCVPVYRNVGRLRPRCRRTSERRRIGQRVAAVGRVIGVAVAAPVIVVIEAETEARHDAPAAIEIPCVAEGTARLGKVLPRNAATESRAAEMAPTKVAAHARANANAADVSGAHASAAEPAY